MTAAGRPSDEALWGCVATTLREVVLPALDDQWARAATVQLVGLAAYARTRAADPAVARAEELGRALDELAANELVAGHWPGDALVAAAAALAAAVGRRDEAAEAVRARLRPLLVRHLDEDVTEHEVLLGPFRGRLPDA